MAILPLLRGEETLCKHFLKILRSLFFDGNINSRIISVQGYIHLLKGFGEKTDDSMKSHSDLNSSGMSDVVTGAPQRNTNNKANGNNELHNTDGSDDGSGGSGDEMLNNCCSELVQASQDGDLLWCDRLTQPTDTNVSDSQQYSHIGSCNLPPSKARRPLTTENVYSTCGSIIRSAFKQEVSLRAYTYIGLGSVLEPTKMSIVSKRQLHRGGDSNSSHSRSTTKFSGNKVSEMRNTTLRFLLSHLANVLKIDNPLHEGATSNQVDVVVDHQGNCQRNRYNTPDDKFHPPDLDVLLTDKIISLASSADGSALGGEVSDATYLSTSLTSESSSSECQKLRILLEPVNILIAVLSRYIVAYWLSACYLHNMHCNEFGRFKW